MRGHRIGRYVRAAALIAAVVLAWLFLAPPQLGGSTSYVVITGDSMEPLLHADDLAIVRQSPYYEVGDVVAYQSDEIDRLVLHRIVEREDGRLVLQGDNNDFLDPERPGESDLEGALWVNVPRAGVVFRFLQGPIGIALGAIVILALLGAFSVTRSRRRSGRHSVKRKPAPQGSDVVAARRPPPPPPPRRSAPALLAEASERDGDLGKRRRVAQLTASVAGVAFLAFVVVGALAMMRPASVEVSDEIFFDHSGTFSYGASAPGSSAYDGPNVSTGEPIFLRLVDRATFTFHYSFDSDLAHEVTTTARMTARLGAENGLSRTLDLSGVEAEGGEETSVSAVMSLHRLRDMVREIEKETGVEQGIYTVTFVPEVDVFGTLGDQALETTFSPALGLEFDSLQLRTVRDSADDEVNPFTPQETASLEVVTERPNQVMVLNRAVPMATVERVSVVGAGAALLVLLVALVVLASSRPKDEPERIAAKYGAALIEVAEAPTHVDIVEVTDFKTLVRLAEQLETAVLHERRAGGHSYLVPHDGILYRYRSGSRVEPRPVSAAPAPPAPAERKAQ